jgi:hypothetical protein
VASYAMGELCTSERCLMSLHFENYVITSYLIEIYTLATVKQMFFHNTTVTFVGGLPEEI